MAHRNTSIVKLRGTIEIIKIRVTHEVVWEKCQLLLRCFFIFYWNRKNWLYSCLSIPRGMRPPGLFLCYTVFTKKLLVKNEPKDKKNAQPKLWYWCPLQYIHFLGGGYFILFSSVVACVLSKKDTIMTISLVIIIIIIRLFFFADFLIG